MAHHQHHGAEHLSASPQTMLGPAAASHLPSISEDELVAEADEPPEDQSTLFKKHDTPKASVRQASLLTRALHSDAESHDESLNPSVIRHPSRSSTCSTYSAFTSEDGLTSPGTRPSSIGSPPRYLFTKPTYQKPTPRAPIAEQADADPLGPISASPTSEPAVEQQLGRRRCVSFLCNQKEKRSAAPPTSNPSPKDTVPAEAPRRPCALKFACPSKIFSCDLTKEKRPSVSRPKSPPPAEIAASPPRRSHRGSDTTLKNESPRSSRKLAPSLALLNLKSSFTESEPEHKPDGLRFHAFASSEDEVEDWTHESTVPKCPLTVDDTLQKEMAIRKIGKEAEDEALEEEDDDDHMELNISGDDINSDFDDDVSDAGFQTDDEEGFAESDESDDDSDYEWWAPKKTASDYDVEHSLKPPEFYRPSIADRRPSDSSINSDLAPALRPRYSRSPLPSRKKSTSIPIRPASPDLPDSTDFVCGTLDEDQPLQQAYISHLEKRKAAKHRAKPQDIDPTFPTSDPEAETDEEDDEDLRPNHNDSDSVNFGKRDVGSVGNDEPRRGRTLTIDTKCSPSLSSHGHVSPIEPTTAKKVTAHRSPPPPSSSNKKKMVHRSPPPPAMGMKRAQTARSPAPRQLFSHSPRRMRSPPVMRLTSPPPSRRASPSRAKPISFTPGFLAERPQLTYTTSLPRSPAPFLRRRSDEDDEDSTDMATPRQDIRRGSSKYLDDDEHEENDEDDDEGAQTAKEDSKPSTGYNRGAIDIVQGLERKRLKRREKFYEKYRRQCDRKAAKGEAKRPQPGLGAQRMKQVGLECAVYRGQRMLSI